MDIEHLKLILETVSSVSGDAAAIAITFIIFENLLPFICWMTFLFLFYKVAIVLIGKIPSCSEDEFFKEMRDILRLRDGSSGILSGSEKIATKNKIKDLALKSRE